ncbi:serine O-acetyltransferase [Empedobacter falsenii]
MTTKEVLKYIYSDLCRYTNNISIKNLLFHYYFNRGFKYMLWFRFTKHNNLFIRRFSFLILNIKRIKYKIDISHKTQIGYGFYIGHSGPIVINPTTIIGNNVNVSQYTSIGANEGPAAIIKDEVYIGPNVCIIENVIIGSKVTIGAGSVVTKNIPDNATVVGNYAKVINYDNPGKYILNKFKI